MDGITEHPYFEPKIQNLLKLGYCVFWIIAGLKSFNVVNGVGVIIIRDISDI
jgi:hypothetical protein